ncbi:hypothetical protein BJX76DRAFT_350775 [Aspergillus varians]
MGPDIEKDGIKIRYVQGFPSLADFIASDHDSSTAIFKRFDRLSARNLLYLQSELAELEALQDEYDREDYQTTNPGSNDGRRDWAVFKNRAKDKSGAYNHDKERWKLAMKIRRKLKKYREALLLDSTLLSMRKPTTQAHEAFHKHFWHEGGSSEPFPTLQGGSRTVYDNREDLVALVRQPEEDRLSAFLRKYCRVLFLERRHNEPGGLVYLSSRRISLVSMTLTILSAAALLFGAIFNLYYVEDQTKRLGIIAGYTTAFALCVTLLTNARRAEIFSASAAYAAVLVVFVSGDIGG